jgi:hypothetical protein
MEKSIVYYRKLREKYRKQKNETGIELMDEIINKLNGEKQTKLK